MKNGIKEAQGPKEIPTVYRQAEPSAFELPRGAEYQHSPSGGL